MEAEKKKLEKVFSIFFYTSQKQAMNREKKMFQPQVHRMGSL
jgi:hypothetical protein